LKVTSLQVNRPNSNSTTYHPLINSYACLKSILLKTAHTQAFKNNLRKSWGMPKFLTSFYNFAQRTFHFPISYELWEFWSSPLICYLPTTLKVSHTFTLTANLHSSKVKGYRMFQLCPSQILIFPLFLAFALSMKSGCFRELLVQLGLNSNVSYP
jgi:hypothetical protein